MLRLLRNLLLRMRGFDLSLSANIAPNSVLDVSRSSSSSIQIGKGVIIKQNCELRVYGPGKIILHDYVKLDNDVRIISANGSTVEIMHNTKLGKGTIVNAGANCFIGKSCLISGYCYIQCSKHGTIKSSYIQQQPHSHAPISIGNDCLRGCFSFASPGTVISDGVICSSHSYLTGTLESHGIYIGRPAILTKYRQ